MQKKVWLPVQKLSRYVTDSLFRVFAGCRAESVKSKDAGCCFFSSLSSQQQQHRRRSASGRPIDPHRVTVRSCSSARKCAFLTNTRLPATPFISTSSFLPHLSHQSDRTRVSFAFCCISISHIKKTPAQ